MTMPFAFWKVSEPPELLSSNYDQGQPEGSGASIVLTGNGFNGATPYVDGVAIAPGNFTIDSATQCTFILPAHAAGAVNITMRGPGGESDPLPFLYWSPAQLTLGWWHRANGETGWNDATGIFDDISGNNRDGTGSNVTDGTAILTNVPPRFSFASGSSIGVVASKPIKADGSRYFYAYLFKVTAFNTNAVAIYDNEAVWCNGAGGSLWMGLFVKGSGAAGFAGVYHWDGAAKSVLSAIVTDTWYLVVGYEDGTNQHMIINATTPAPTLAGAVAGWVDTGNQIGKNTLNNRSITGDVLESMVTGEAVASQGYGTTEAALILKYCRQRYGLALT